MTTSAQVSNNNEDEVYKVSNRLHSNMDFVPGEVLVKMKDASPITVRRVKSQFQATDNETFDAVLAEFGVSEMEQLLSGEKQRRNLRRAKAPNGGFIEERDLSQLYRVRMANPDIMKTHQLAERLEALNDVEFAEPNYKAYIMGEIAQGEPIALKPRENPSYGLQWGIPAMKINELWTKPVINSTRPIIAILDTGVDTTHPDLKDNCIAGYDFINETSEVRDNNSHGTHVAGIAAACDNNIGIIGANPRALIMPVAVMQSDGTGDIATIIKGINYAVQNGATVLNMSFGSYSNSKALRQALAAAYQSAVLVASAGNDGHGIYKYPHSCPLSDKHCRLCGPTFPAAYSFVLGVQANSQDGSLASFSNFDCDGPTYSEAADLYGDEGFNYELSAPGVTILSTVPNGGYKQYNGTSMAAPLVAGAISALRMVKEYETQEKLWGDLLHTSDFLAAYNLTDRPAELEFLGLQFDDRQELVEGENHSESDGHIDAGETIKLYPVLRTVFGEASNIKLHLEVAEYEDESIVTITQNNVDFGYFLSPYGKAVSENPLIFKTKGNTVDGRHIKMKVVATCDESSQSVERPFTIVVTNMVKINGLISEDRTLTADHVYLVNDNLGIMDGATLTIEPGTRLEFMEGMGLSSYGKLVAIGTPKKPIVFSHHTGEGAWAGIKTYNPTKRDTISYCRIEGFNPFVEQQYPYMEDCVVIPGNNDNMYAHHLFQNLKGIRNNVTQTNGYCQLVYYLSDNLHYSNIVNNYFGILVDPLLPDYSQLNNNNYFNNSVICHKEGKYYGKKYSIACYSNVPLIEKSSNPSYLGTSNEDVIRPYIYEIGNAPDTYGQIDLNNMPTRPYAEAHGIVWKVCVNGKDAQDEYEDLAPLGVGRHKFEVYYNRPMNKAIAPNIAFGVREPYTQNAVNEDGTWNEDGTIYTAYVTITKRTQSDGINRIYVWGGEDDEYFECPYEKTRFNVNIQAANSMSTGFVAEGNAGCVTLLWNKSEADDIEDAMGYNIYRYTERVRYEEILDEWGNKIWDDETDDWLKREIIERDTLRINPYVIDVDTESYLDRAVTPGETYYYYYKLQGTNLKEYGISNTVNATPKNGIPGDVTGDGFVTADDVIALANYILGRGILANEAAAYVNDDDKIDIADVAALIGIIKNM